MRLDVRDSLEHDGFQYSHRNGEFRKPKPSKPCAFEQKASKLGLLPEAYRDSAKLKKWSKQNRLKRYVPEELLSYWGLPVRESEIHLSDK